MVLQLLVSRCCIIAEACAPIKLLLRLLLELLLILVVPSNVERQHTIWVWFPAVGSRHWEMVDDPVLILISGHYITDPLLVGVGPTKLRDLTLCLQPLVELVVMVRGDSSKVTWLIRSARLLQTRSN